MHVLISFAGPSHSTRKGAMGMMQAIGGVLVPIFRTAAAGAGPDALKQLMDVWANAGSGFGMELTALFFYSVLATPVQLLRETESMATSSVVFQRLLCAILSTSTRCFRGGSRASISRRC
jgi:hypothetical protein